MNKGTKFPEKRRTISAGRKKGDKIHFAILSKIVVVVSIWNIYQISYTI